MKNNLAQENPKDNNRLSSVAESETGTNANSVWGR